MNLYHRDKAKAYRRLMLDVLEVCPRRFKDKIMQDMADIRDEGDFIVETFADHLHSDHLQFFYRLRSGRLLRNFTPHQNALLRSIVDRLEEAYRYDTGQDFRFETAWEKQVRRKEWQVRSKEYKERIQRQAEWSQKHPHLSVLSYWLWCTPFGYFAVPLLVLVVMLLVFGRLHTPLSFWH